MFEILFPIRKKEYKQKQGLIKNTMSNRVATVFVCHSNESIAQIIHYNQSIILVGDQEISEEYLKYPKLIVARNLEHNIEHEKRLLSFTAWYAIVKNNLFLDYNYICVLEYDVVLSESFQKSLQETVDTTHADTVSFIKAEMHWFHHDMNRKVTDAFLESKNIDTRIVSTMEHWGSSTNQCIRRDILRDYVDWFYPAALVLKRDDPTFYSYYHERLFMVYLTSKKLNLTYCLDILKHLYKVSHAQYV